MSATFDVENCIRIKDNFAEHKNIQSHLIQGKNPPYQPRFSIVITTYNRPDTLPQAIDSAINQDYDGDYNIIISDNNPERGDKTELLMRRYSDKNFVKYYKHDKNLLMHGNWNRSVLLSDAEFLVLLHDDDLLSPCFLSDCDRIINHHPDIDILNCKIYEWRQRNINEKTPTIKYKQDKFPLWKIKKGEAAIFKVYTPSGILLKKSSVIKIGGFDNESFPSLDLYFAVKASIHLNSYYYLKENIIYRWSINESVNYNTRIGFIDKDLPLLKYCYKKGHINWITYFTRKYVYCINNHDSLIQSYSNQINKDVKKKLHSKMINFRPFRCLICRIWGYFEYIHKNSVMSSECI